MEQMWNVLSSSCPSRTSLAKIANKWTAMVVVSLGSGPLRFGELRTRVQGISPKVLTDTLRDLERDGMASRHVFPHIPPHVEYELTDLGHSLFEPLSGLVAWAECHLEEVQEHRADYDAKTPN